MQGQLAIGLLISGGIIIGSLIVGVIIVASGQLMLAVREVALNTRQQERRGQYKALEILSNLITAIGYIIMLAGVGFGIISILTSLQVIS